MIINDFMPKDCENLFEEIKSECKFEQMAHNGGIVSRLISIQAVVEPNKVPIYRHPIDIHPETKPFSKTINMIVEYVNKELGTDINHVVVQFYRHGYDFIGEHTDKTIDIKYGSSILNLSFGATRTMILKEKTKLPEEKEYKKIKYEMKNNSMFILDNEMNRKYVHTIRKEVDRETGERISLTMRCINTFMTTSEPYMIYGQGARNKTIEAAIFNGMKIEKNDVGDLINAFRKENTESNFDWVENYGRGFDIINIQK